MLELRDVSRIYETDNFKQKALDKINICFRNNEFVSILGPSGSGKTTLLNIIGGLDNYTSGDLVINGISTKQYKDKDWDTYRNHRIGFVFQSYNLIPHQSILSNVELALTLSGVGVSERKRRAKEALKKVGLLEHINKRPNQLSGGQMQRVAIARALVNNPDILLADEPTGALDSKTSVQIMNLLKEVAQDRLVIMVTHNAELANTYSTRIIELKDGHVLGDTDPYEYKLEDEKKKRKTKKKNMSFKTALSLSLNNLLTKKGRTILTSFAGSIGIIGIALILSLSSGVQNYIDRIQEETLTSYPLSIESNSIDLTSVMSQRLDEENSKDDRQENMVYSNNTITDTLSFMSSSIKANNLELFKNFIEDDSDIDDYTSAIQYEYNLNLQIYKSDTSSLVRVHPDTVMETLGMATADSTGSTMMMGDVWSELFENAELNEKLYEVVSGRMPREYNEVVILVDEDNQITDYILYALGLREQEELKDIYNKVLNGEEVEPISSSYSYDELLDLSFKVLLNTDYYEKVGNIWVDKSNDSEYLISKLEDALEIKVVGIIKPDPDAAVSSNALGGILYTDALEKYVIDKINASEIVKEQKETPDINVITGLPFSNEEFSMDDLSYEQQMYLSSLSATELADVISKYQQQANFTYDSVLATLGSVDLERPSAIYMYATDFEAKDKIKEIISDYNDSQVEAGHEENVINYSDLVGMLMSSVTSIVDMISYVLIGFVSISLVVSSIMIGIITYISVLERTKEIGILRAVGASKKDVSRVFNAETLIVGLVSGLFGIGITVLLNVPINLIIGKLAGVRNLSSLPFGGAVILVVISVILTMIAGLIPSRMASRKDPVVALRTE